MGSVWDSLASNNSVFNAVSLSQFLWVNQFAVLHLISWLVNRRMLIPVFFMNFFFHLTLISVFFLGIVILEGPDCLLIS